MFLATLKQQWAQRSSRQVANLKQQWAERSLRQNRDDRCICCGLQATNYVITARKYIPMCPRHAADIPGPQIVFTLQGPTPAPVLAAAT